MCNKDASLLVVGNTDSSLFPDELRPYTSRSTFGKGRMKVNFLVNYSWWWDLAHAFSGGNEISDPRNFLPRNTASKDISRIELIIRWGGRRRLSGLLPIQTIYSDFYVIDDLWPDFQVDHLYEALRWYEDQDVTLGG